MIVIYKFPLSITDHQFLKVPGVTLQPLTVQMQNGIPMLWLMLETGEPYSYPVHCFGTGHEISFDVYRFQNYVGTIQLKDGTVWHFFTPKVQGVI